MTNLAFGFASLNGGTSGGSGGATVTVSTGAQLQAAINGARSAPLTIYVDGKITLENSGVQEITIAGRDNISIVGTRDGAEFDGIGFRITDGSSNLILQNLKIHDVKSGAKDAIGIEGPSKNIWIDHNELYSSLAVGKDYYDGLLDIKRGAEFITVSNNYFHDHHKASLNGYSDEDAGARYLTYANNMFEDIGSRTPSVRFGHVHVYNNYYTDVSTSGVNLRMGAVGLIEDNVFENSKNPIVSLDSSAIGYWELKGNIMSNVSWSKPGAGEATAENGVSTGSYDAPYAYTALSAKDVKAYVTTHAGVGHLHDGPTVPETKPAPSVPPTPPLGDTKTPPAEAGPESSLPSPDGGVTLMGKGNADVLTGGNGNDAIDGGGGADRISGGAGDDRLVGGSNNDVLSGGSGHDVLLGGEGRDSLAGDIGNDRLDGGNSADQLDGGSGADMLVGGAGNDALLGGDDNDSLDGGAGKDALFGGAGADVLFGGTDSDTLEGGDGRDTYVFANGHGHDTVRDFRSGEGLVFESGMFQSADAARSAMTQTSAGVELKTGAESSILFAGSTLADARSAAISFTGSEPIFAQGAAAGFESSGADDIVRFEKGLKADGGAGFDVITLDAETPTSVSLAGSSLKGFEAVVSTGATKEQVSLSLNELMAESGANGRAGFAAILGDQAGDKISLSGSGWKLAADVGNDSNASPLARGLTDGELATITQAHGSSAGDLNGFVFQKGSQSVTVWTDLEASDLHLNGTSVDHLA